MLIFSRLVLLYFCFNSGMKAATYLSYPKSVSPLASVMLAFFACLAIAALYLAYNLNNESRTADKIKFRYFTKIFASFIGLISIGRCSIGLIITFQTVDINQLNNYIMNILIFSILGHIATIFTCIYLLFYHFKTIAGHTASEWEGTTRVSTVVTELDRGMGDDEAEYNASAYEIRDLTDLVEAGRKVHQKRLESDIK